MDRQYLYRLRASDEQFRKDWDEAVELGTSMLEDEASRRANAGWLEPVFYQGVEVGHVRKFSDQLLLALLKARKPDMYRERTSTELTGAGGKDLVVQITRLTDADHSATE